MTKTYKCAFCFEEEEMPIVIANRYGTIRDWENMICQRCFEKRVKEIRRIKRT